MCTFAKINRPRRQQDASASRHVDHDRKADARTARNTAVNWAASSMPEENRTTAPEDPLRRRRRALNRCSRNGLAHDRNEAGRCRRRRFPGRTRQVLEHRTSPAEHLLRTDLPPPRNLRHTATWNQGLCDDPCLLIRRPAPPAAGSVRTSTRRKSPFASSLTSNITIARSPLPQAKSSTSGKATKQGHQSTAYG